MKNLLLLTAALFLSCALYSQDYMNKIAEEACECFSKIPSNTEPEQYQMKLGLCMIEIAAPYKKQIKKDYGVDMDNIAKEGAKLGQIVGLRMASVCPDAMVKMAEAINGKKEAKEAGAQNITGTITKIEKDFFVVFSLKDESGKTTKYYWLSFVEAGLDLVNGYEAMLDKKVELTFEYKEFFDPKIKEYRAFPVIRNFNPVKE